MNITVPLRDALSELFWVETDHVTVAPVLNRRFGCALVTSTQPGSVIDKTFCPLLPRPAGAPYDDTIGAASRHAARLQTAPLTPDAPAELLKCLRTPVRPAI